MHSPYLLPCKAWWELEKPWPGIVNANILGPTGISWVSVYITNLIILFYFIYEKSRQNLSILKKKLQNRKERMIRKWGIWFKNNKYIEAAFYTDFLFYFNVM